MYRVRRTQSKDEQRGFVQPIKTTDPLTSQTRIPTMNNDAQGHVLFLQKYTHFSNENRRESEPVPNEASLSENQETESLKENLKESVVKTEKEVFEDEIFRIVPARYKEKAKNIFQFLKLQESFSWNSDGEIIYKNTVIPGSNIAFS
ncbi:hypothetical protein TNCV_2992541 [Trichonephila clavipes]|nr:hypothetical protein TNCV_2992541 [Trichonephila clavipes]